MPLDTILDSKLWFNCADLVDRVIRISVEWRCLVSVQSYIRAFELEECIVNHLILLFSTISVQRNSRVKIRLKNLNMIERLQPSIS